LPVLRPQRGIGKWYDDLPPGKRHISLPESDQRPHQRNRRGAFYNVPSVTAVRMNNWKCWGCERKFALTSIALSLLEIGSFLLAALLINYSLVNSQPHPSPGVVPATIYRVLAGVWLVGTPLTLISAALALGLDSRRRCAFIALIVSAIAIAFCTLQMLV
jgi:hypothetical protein